jgi:predicted DNA-binding transcriptional regulator AlpA
MERTMTSIRLLSAKDLAQILGNRGIAYRLLNRSDFPVVQIGGRKLVREDRFIEWLEKQEKEV